MSDNKRILFEPWSVRTLVTRNRLVMAPMTRTHSPQGVAGPDVAKYYARRAEADVGLITTEGVGIDEAQAVAYGQGIDGSWRCGPR
jgi:2,4-dienoyl-CoA reductase-like NADH-dependent reductase (Old Yellow Enzyme family)